MAEKIIRARHRRKIRPFPVVESLPIFGRHLSPARIALLIGATALAIMLGVVFFSYGAKLYNHWRETRLLQRATSTLQQGKFQQAAQTAREVLELHPDSLPAFYILAEAGKAEPRGNSFLARTNRAP